MASYSRVVGLIIFVAGTTLCGVWAYVWVAPLTKASGDGSGGIGAVSMGVVEALLETLAVFVPLFITFRLTRAPRRGLATVWRWTHVAATIVLVAIAIASSWPVTIVVLALFLPVQVFFANGAIAMWIGK